MSAVETQIESGQYGILGLAAVAACVLIPITQYKTLYGISVGYGSSVAAIAWALYSVFAMDLTTPAGWLVAAIGFYGARLAVYLFIRDVGGWKPASGYSKGDWPRLNRIVFAVGLAMFYACMTAPVLYACRIQSNWDSKVTVGGSVCAWVFVISQAVADGHKHVAKLRADTRTKNKFSGPSGGLYRLTRHPNYTSEVFFWTSVFAAGLFSLSPVSLVVSFVGWIGIVQIMLGSTKRLVEQHQQKYGRQKAYKEWKDAVPYPLFPFVKGAF